jgi:hypothetical protein
MLGPQALQESAARCFNLTILDKLAIMGNWRASGLSLVERGEGWWLISAVV